MEELNLKLDQLEEKCRTTEELVEKAKIGKDSNVRTYGDMI